MCSKLPIWRAMGQDPLRSRGDHSSLFYSFHRSISRNLQYPKCSYTWALKRSQRAIHNIVINPEVERRL